MKLKNFTAVLLGVFLWAVCICSFSSVAEATGYIPKGEKNKASSSWKKNNTASADYQLNIGLANGVVQASVGMNSEYTVLDRASGSVLGRFKGNVLSVITVSGNRLPAARLCQTRSVTTVPPLQKPAGRQAAPRCGTSAHRPAGP